MKEKDCLLRSAGSEFQFEGSANANYLQNNDKETSY